MIPNEREYQRRRIATSYVTTIISITLVLFMLGLLGMLVLHAKKLSDYVKENIGFSIMINEGVKEVDIFELQKKLDKQRFVKSTVYITRERAAREFSDELGEDFVGFLGYNPLLPSIELRLNASYANPDSILFIEKELRSYSGVKEVDYHRSLVDQINRNVNKISLVILGFSLILLLIAIALINNTIRLSVYAKRFLIRSMQLVGATQKFIQRPFLIKAALNGFLSGVIAIGLLLLLLYFSAQEIPELLELQDIRMFTMLFALVILLGIVISWISTFFAVRKYIRMKTDSLYN
ncbi:MAG: cell division protein FtsX [Bacteroidales bacterium]|nr:cell division protein FtsX [Bacteroidota bacterium]MBL6949065.1 cell division protein FtsX [Bacteroidales bacterium]